MKNNNITNYLAIDNVGKVRLKYSNRAKYVRLSIKSNGNIRLLIPNHISVNDAIKFVFSKVSWIEKKKSILDKKKLLKINLSKIELQNFWRETETKLLLFSNQYGLKYNKLNFKTLKSRWGSCSSNNTICLNNLLYYLPDYLKEYVMLHELIHTKIKNHSREFWDALEEICKDSKFKRKELRDNYSIC